MFGEKNAQIFAEKKAIKILLFALDYLLLRHIQR